MSTATATGDNPVEVWRNMEKALEVELEEQELDAVLDKCVLGGGGGQQ